MSESGKEIEIKLRAASVDDAAHRIEGAGFEVSRARVFETNLLLDTETGLLRTRGEALRVRERGGETIVTYKGPAAIGRHKSREEVETMAGDAAVMLAIFARLGFDATYRYEKFRTEFARGAEPGIVTLDETPIGVFIEVEGAGHWIDTVAEELGFTEKDYINDSYSTLFRRHCANSGTELGDGMTFRVKP